MSGVPVLNFLLKTPAGWHGDFALPSGKIPYAFVVDGEVILDPSNPESEIIAPEDAEIELSITEVK